LGRGLRCSSEQDRKAEHEPYRGAICAPASRPHSMLHFATPSSISFAGEKNSMQ
jgi:hypothetical protein